MNDKKQIHPELQRFAKNIPYHIRMIKWVNIFQSLSFYLTTIPKGAAHQYITITGYQELPYKVHIFEPANVKEKLPCLIYVHGGAFSYKASAYHKKLACIYAMRAKCRVFFPDYHVLPKYPYPAAYADVLSLYKHILKNSETYQINRKKIGLAGDSAGAAIAALICHHYEAEHLQRPCVQMLIYPVTDVDMQTDSMKKFTDTPLWNAKNNKRMWKYYGKNLKKEHLYDASPLHNSLPDSIPDTYIETAEYDCLHDEGILYAKKLRKAGAAVALNETIGTFHGYDSAIHTDIAKQNIEKRISFLQNRLHDDTES